MGVTANPATWRPRSASERASTLLSPTFRTGRRRTTDVSVLLRCLTACSLTLMRSGRVRNCNIGRFSKWFSRPSKRGVATVITQIYMLF